MKQMHFRQGDILFVRVDKEPKDVKTAQVTNRYTVAEGEVTGHFHMLHGEGMKVITTEDGTVYTSLPEGGKLVHDEHAQIDVEEGTYKIVRQREYSPQEIRRVVD